MGVYNGQTLNVSERNDNKHIVVHATYPMELPYGQIIQFGVDAYRGTFNVGAPSGTGLAGTPALVNNGNILDERVGVPFLSVSLNRSVSKRNGTGAMDLS